MSLPLLSTAGDFQQARDVLRIGLDTSAVSDATVASDPFYGVAERTITMAYPTAGSEADATKLLHLKTAAVFLTAANLAASLALPEREEFLTYKYQLPALDWAQRAGDLRERGLAELAQVTGQTLAQVTLPRLFAAAPGNRGY